MKIEDILQEYEEIALTFYDNPKIITALKENRMLRNDKRAASQELYEKNSSSIESKLYGIKSAQKYIVNIQFVSPEQQYYMTEPNGYRRGGSIRDLDEFYKSDFYKVPQEKKDTLFGLIHLNRLLHFIKMSRVSMGLLIL